MVRRIPKRGFHNRWAETVAIVNLGVLERNFQSGEEVTPESLRGKGLVKGSYDLLKVLGDGELTKSLKISRPQVQPLGNGEDREGRRPGGRSARQKARGEEQDEERRESERDQAGIRAWNRRAGFSLNP